ncbi:MAG: nucleotide sugar dehydrogenase, partial [Exiguobacterium sp.]|nr:nucleotide sugar dehydrogenase [Exiguobacterium sp.]
MDKLISESRTTRKTIANRHVAVVGLGYVGLPVAVALGGVGDVIGVDINETRINELTLHLDSTREVESVDLEQAAVLYTTDVAKLEEADFIIVAVPTPINDQNQPDLGPICSATRAVGAHLRPGTIVVYESTVYPGLTEEECIPLLEKTSGLRAGIDFKVGYSPERINPGYREHTFRTIKKVVAAEDEETLDVVAAVYETVVDAGVHRASSIKVAEAAKVIENTQRDLNIALMNELAIIFDRM